MITVGTPYTLGAATFPVSDVRCQKPLGQFAPWVISQDMTENVTVKDIFFRSWSLRFSERMAIRDPLSFIGRKSLNENVSLVDKKSLNPRRNIHESFSVSDYMNRIDKASIKDRISISDKLPKRFIANKKETVKGADGYSHKALFSRKFAESASVLEWMNKDFYSYKHESFDVSDGKKFKGDKNVFDTLKTFDTFDRKLIFRRWFNETLNVSDSTYKKYLAFYKELSSVLDGYVHNPVGVISEAIIRDGAMSLSEFQDFSSSPAGYSPFVDFVVGDYEYATALFKFQLQKKETSVNPAVTDMSVHVDIDDVFDSGTITLPAAITKVYYNKSYYTAPAVQATPVDGTTAATSVTAYVLSTDKSDDKGRYFEAVIREDDNNNIVAGTIFWSSVGY